MKKLISIMLALAITLSISGALAGSTEDRIIKRVEDVLVAADYVNYEDFYVRYMEDQDAIFLHTVIPTIRISKVTSSMTDDLYTMYDSLVGFVEEFGDNKAVLSLGDSLSESLYLITEYGGDIIIWDVLKEEVVDLRLGNGTQAA